MLPKTAPRTPVEIPCDTAATGTGAGEVDVGAADDGVVVEGAIEPEDSPDVRGAEAVEDEGVADDTG